MIWNVGATVRLSTNTHNSAGLRTVRHPEVPFYAHLRCLQMMTRQERLDHQNKLRSMKTEAEREQFRNEHHQQMQERAKTKGVTLPDEPPRPGGGMCPGGRGR